MERVVAVAADHARVRPQEIEVGGAWLEVSRLHGEAALVVRRSDVRAPDVADDLFRLQLDQRQRLAIVRSHEIHLPGVGDGGVVDVLRLIEAVDLLLVEVLLFDSLHILRAEQARDVVQDEALVAASTSVPGLARPKGRTIRRGVVNSWSRSKTKSVAPEVVSSHVGCLQNVQECATNGTLVAELLEQEHTCSQPCLRVLMVDLEHSGERRLSDLADRDVVLPFDECLPLLLSLYLVEQVLGADE